MTYESPFRAIEGEVILEVEVGESRRMRRRKRNFEITIKAPISPILHYPKLSKDLVNCKTLLALLVKNVPKNT